MKFYISKIFHHKVSFKKTGVRQNNNIAHINKDVYFILVSHNFIFSQNSQTLRPSPVPHPYTRPYQFQQFLSLVTFLSKLTIIPNYFSCTAYSAKPSSVLHIFTPNPKPLLSAIVHSLLEAWAQRQQPSACFSSKSTHLPVTRNGLSSKNKKPQMRIFPINPFWPRPRTSTCSMILPETEHSPKLLRRLLQNLAMFSILGTPYISITHK